MTKKRQILFSVIRGLLAILIALLVATLLIFLSAEGGGFSEKLSATGDALKQADELQRNAMMLYKESETGIVELLHSITTANEIRKSYVDAVHEYNVMLLELELYTEK